MLLMEYRRLRFRSYRCILLCVLLITLFLFFVAYRSIEANARLGESLVDFENNKFTEALSFLKRMNSNSQENRESFNTPDVHVKDVRVESHDSPTDEAAKTLQSILGDLDKMIVASSEREKSGNPMTDYSSSSSHSSAESHDSSSGQAHDVTNAPVTMTSSDSSHARESLHDLHADMMQTAEKVDHLTVLPVDDVSNLPNESDRVRNTSNATSAPELTSQMDGGSTPIRPSSNSTLLTKYRNTFQPASDYPATQQNLSNIFYNSTTLRNRYSSRNKSRSHPNVTSEAPNTRATLNYRNSILRNSSHVINIGSDCYDLEILMRPCEEVIAWNHSTNHNLNRTNASLSLVIIDIRPVGNTSRVLIHSRNQEDEEKSVGGDSWRVVLHGESSSFIQMFDLLNGSYVGYFVPRRVGWYRLEVALEYSQCDGMRDPPEDWFRRGSIHGKFQPEGIIGVIDHFLNEQRNPDTFYVIRSDAGYELKDEQISPCGSANCSINDRSGFWDSTGWNSNAMNETTYFSNSTWRKLDTLYIYGDSIGLRFYKQIESSTLCRSAFQNCSSTYTWTYTFVNLYNHYEDRTVFDGNDFNATRFLDPIFSVIDHQLVSADSVLVLNFGLHVVMSMSLKQAVELFDTFVRGFLERKQERVADFPLVIWKTTTPPFFENVQVRNATHTRFCSKQRVQVWNTYTTAKACQANIPVLDVYNMAASYPGHPVDHVHLEDEVFRPAEKDLERFLYEYFRKHRT